ALHSFPTRRSSDLAFWSGAWPRRRGLPRLPVLRRALRGPGEGRGDAHHGVRHAQPALLARGLLAGRARLHQLGVRADALAALDGGLAVGERVLRVAELVGG